MFFGAVGSAEKEIFGLTERFSRGVIGTVGTKTTTAGSAATRAKFKLDTAFTVHSISRGGVQWSTSETISGGQQLTNLENAFNNSYEMGLFNSLSGSVTLNYGNGSMSGTVSAFNGMTTDKLRILFDNFVASHDAATGIATITARTVGEIVSGTVLDSAKSSAVKIGSTDYSANIDLPEDMGTAGTASTTRLDFGTLTGSYLADNNIKLTVDGVQYSFVTSGSSSGTQIRVGENDSGAAIATAVANAVTNVGTSASGSAVTFTENIKYLDANHYFRGYSGQILAVDLSDNPQAANNNPNNTPNASNSTGCWIQAGPNAWQGFYINFVDATAATLGVTSVDVSTHANAESAIDTAQKAFNTVSAYRAYFGAMQNRMEHAYDFNMNAAENSTTSESLIRDVDMASEMLQYSCNSILEQAGQSMLAQANQARESMISLLP